MLNISPEPNSGCWLWDGCVGEWGSGVPYGYLNVNGVWTAAHRASYILFKGPIPDKLVVRHKCDVPICINPQHLEIGTTYDNVQDRVRRGRSRHDRGERHHSAKITDATVREIRSLLLSGVAQRAIARRYSIAESLVTLIKQKKRWGHVQ